MWVATPGGRVSRGPTVTLPTPPAPDSMMDSQRRSWGELIGDAPKGLLRRTDWQLFTNYLGLDDRFERTAIAQNALDVASSAPMLMRGSRQSSSRPISA